MPRLVYAALLCLSLIWGGSFYFIKMLLHDFGPWSIACLRSTCGLLVVLLVMLALRKPFGFRAIPWLAMFAMAVINTALPWTLIAFSEQRITSGMASILNATTPVWTVLVGMAFFRGRSGRMQWVGLGVAMIGLLVLLGIRPGALLSVDGIGFAGMMAAACCYGVGSQLSKRLSVRGCTTYQITYGTLLSSAVLCGVMSLTTESIPFSRLTSMSTLPMLVGLGAFGSGIAYLLFYYMVEKGSAEFASMVTYLVPSTALVWGCVLLNESIRWNMLAGLAIILAGVFLAGRKGPGGERLPARRKGVPSS
ncbi:EamA family transporter [Paenibacillus sacheonensis]|uniref:EamA family transporter n=1 Tax=Paenibacillus sacheonensis TaxID=742054 RepID=A0A7X5C0Z8_9BACL|nr:drug/metabolite transporter (DMT)-like permease [Paenibacillus sacheonensis]NBC72121.1 EamA family transporter [Paenibacillus sacheonensis]